jgi:hypothetical protein
MMRGMLSGGGNLDLRREANIYVQYVVLLLQACLADADVGDSGYGLDQVLGIRFLFSSSFRYTEVARGFDVGCGVEFMWPRC